MRRGTTRGRVERVSRAPHHAVSAHVWADEPDPLDVVGVAEDRKPEAYDLANLPGPLLRTLDNRGLVASLGQLSAGMDHRGRVPASGCRPPRWEGHRIAVRLETRQRDGYMKDGGA